MNKNDKNEKFSGNFVIGMFYLSIDNIVVDGVITLNDIIYKPCHYSWPGRGNN